MSGDFIFTAAAFKDDEERDTFLKQVRFTTNYGYATAGPAGPTFTTDDPDIVEDTCSLFWSELIGRWDADEEPELLDIWSEFNKGWSATFWWVTLVVRWGGPRDLRPERAAFDALFNILEDGDDYDGHRILEERAKCCAAFNQSLPSVYITLGPGVLDAFRAARDKRAAEVQRALEDEQRDSFLASRRIEYRR